MSISTEVDAIVALMAAAESLADQAKAKLDAIPDHMTLINGDPENANVGALLTKSISLRARAIGLNFKADLFALHNDMTEAARLRGIDIPGVEGGGGR